MGRAGAPGRLRQGACGSAAAAIGWGWAVSFFQRGLRRGRNSANCAASSIVASNQRDAGVVTFWDTFDACVRQDAKAAIRDLQFPGIALTYRW